MTYTVEGNPLAGTEIIVGYENDMAFNNGEKILLMSGAEAPKGTGTYSARYVLPVGEKQFKAVFPIPSPPYAETRNIQIYAQTGNKQLLYAEAQKDARQNYVLAGNAYARVVEPYTVEEDKPGNPPDDPSGDLVIYKLDAVTGEALSGVTFDVYNSKGQRIYSGTTGAGGSYKPNIRDESGKIIKDTYWIVERTTNTGYQYTEPLTQSIKVDEENVTYTVTFRDFPSQTVTIIKEDAQTGTPVNGCEYEIMQIDGKGAWRAVATTAGKGEAKWDNVPDGTYLVREVSTISGYILDPTPQYVTVRNGQAPSLKFLDSKYPGLSIMKMDKLKGSVIANQATFHVEQIDGACGVSVITGLEPGGYAVREVSAPDNYTLSENTLQTGFLKADGTSILEFTFANYPFGTLLVSKVDAKTGAALANARFEVKDSDGLVVGTANGIYTTDINGEFIIPNLDPKSYVVTELSAPEGYAKDPMPQTINVKHDGNIYKLTFENEPLGTLVILKKDEATREPLANAEFKVTTSKGTVAGTGNGIYKTDANGSITIPNLDKDTYLIEEIKAPDGFLLENKSQTIAVEYGKTHTVYCFKDVRGKSK